MVNKFGCDICGQDVVFDDNSVLVTKGEKMNDLCPGCMLDVQAFINEKRYKLESSKEAAEAVQEILPLEEAKEILKKEGFIFYKPKPRVTYAKLPGSKASKK